MIRLTNLRKTYRLGSVEVPALRGVSLEIAAGDFAAVMGPSGSGKSTLLHLLGLLDAPDAGSHHFLGREVSGLSEDERAALRGRAVGFVFQQYHLLPRLRARQNVALPGVYAGNRRNASRAESLLRDVGLEDRAGHRPGELSGGQQQRVAVARALLNDPPLILADEPTGNLDSVAREEIMGLLARLNEEGRTLVVVTHDEDTAAHCKRIIHLRDGRVASDRRRSALVPRPEPQWTPPPQGGSRFGAHAREAVRAVLGHPMRSLLSVLGIFIGVGALVAMLALGAGARRALERRLASLGSNMLSVRPGQVQVGGLRVEAGEAARLVPEDAEDIAATIPGVKRAGGYVSGPAQLEWGDRNCQSPLAGVVPAFAEMRRFFPETGRFFGDQENQQRALVAVLGAHPARELFGEGDPLGQYVRINRISFQVVGVLPWKGSPASRDQDDLVLIPLLTAMRRVLGRERVDGIDIEMTGPEQVRPGQRAVEAYFRRTRRVASADDGLVEVRDMAELRSTLQEGTRIMTRLLAVVAAISLLVGGIGIMNIMLVSVTERRREIGLRKALGARRRDILGQFLVEGLAVTLLGGAAGALLGALVAAAIGLATEWEIHVSLGSVALALGFCGAVGLAFSLWPARQAAGLHPIDALRAE